MRARKGPGIILSVESRHAIISWHIRLMPVTRYSTPSSIVMPPAEAEGGCLKRAYGYIVKGGFFEGAHGFSINDSVMVSASAATLNTTHNTTNNYYGPVAQGLMAILTACHIY